MDLKNVFVYRDDEFDRQNFEAIVEGLVASGTLTREQGEYGTGLENVKDEFRAIAEAELERQGK